METDSKMSVDQLLFVGIETLVMKEVMGQTMLELLVETAAGR